MVAQSFSTGATTFSPFSSVSGADYVSAYIPFNDQKSPLSGAFLASGTPGYATGAGLLGTSEVKRSDNLAHRPIMFNSLSMPFTDASSNVQLQFATTVSGGGGNQGPTQADAATVTWNTSTAAEPLNFAVNQCTTSDTAVTYYVGFEKQDANTTTFRRGASSNTTIAPNGIYFNGVLQDGTGGTSSWSGTAVRTTVSWRHVPNHPTSLSATGGTNPGEVNLSWTAPSDNGGSTVYGYRIAYKKTGTSTWFVYGTNTYRSPSGTYSTSETVRGLDPGAEYSFVVAGLNEVSDRYSGGVAYPDRTYADYSSTEAHTGQNSNIATGTATALATVDPEFGAYSTALARFVAAAPKVRNSTATFVDGTPWIYDGTKWNRPVQVTGGTVSTYTSGGITYTVHTFSSSGNLNVRECQHGLAISYLVVGGGGGGGGRYNAGGGGAGGVLSGTATLTSNTNYGVAVGLGGTGGGESTKGLTGGDSSFNGIVAKGGGGGGSWTFSEAGVAQGLPGGSGGGNSGYTGPAAGGLGTSGQGNNGGLGAGFGGGGGGGAGGAGSNGTTSTGGAGGVGVSNSITGSAVFYGGGGGGASYSSATVPQGGNGGGGNGAPGPNTTAGGVPTAGTNGRGGGGGGANGYGTTGATSVGGNGGNGVVIIRYISSIT